MRSHQSALVLLAVLTALGVFTQPLFASKHAAIPAPSSETLSYSIGVSIGRNLKNQDVDLDTAAFVEGLKDAMGDKKLKLSPEEMQKAMSAFSASRAAKQQAMQAHAGQANQKQGKEFLAANKKKKGVVTTASGLQYKVLKKGKGTAPKATDRVEVHYKGQLLDGTEFDSSYSRGKPATFPVNQVIPGWTEVLQLMNPGSKWEVWIPSNLAYGPRGAGRKIGPHATLTFQIELLKVEP